MLKLKKPKKKKPKMKMKKKVKAVITSRRKETRSHKVRNEDEK